LYSALLYVAVTLGQHEHLLQLDFQEAPVGEPGEWVTEGSGLGLLIEAGVVYGNLYPREGPIK